MELQQFEQAILKLAFETEARITTASVAYYLGVPSRDANRLLNELLEQGVLELDSDESGNLFYRVPNHPGVEGKFDALKDLRDEEHGTTAPLHRVERRPTAAQFAPSTPDGSGDEVEAFSPVVSSPGHPAEDMGSAMPARPVAYGKRVRESRPERPPAFTAREDFYGRTESNGRDGAAAGGPSSGVIARRPPRWGTVSTRVARPDASVDNCGSSSVVVSTAVRCEPRPLPESKPVITSCSESIVTTRDQQGEHSWFGQPSESTALVPAGETALARDYYIEQPEHQPGMALLLSLILCGTGQIYNGEISKGIMMMVLCFLLWFVLLGWVVHIWSIVDAVVVAERLNKRANT